MLDYIGYSVVIPGVSSNIMNVFLINMYISINNVYICTYITSSSEDNLSEIFKFVWQSINQLGSWFFQVWIVRPRVFQSRTEWPTIRTSVFGWIDFVHLRETFFHKRSISKKQLLLVIIERIGCTKSNQPS